MNNAGYIDCNNARSGYNEAKRTCEALCQSYRMQYGVDSVVVRLARVFGADNKKDSKAMSQFMEKAVLGEDIILKSKGLQRYSYCYVADAASAIINVLINGKNTHHRMAAFYMCIIKKLKYIKTINTIHNTFDDKRKLTKFAFDSTENIAVGNSVFKNMTEHYKISPKKIRIIYNKDYVVNSFAKLMGSEVYQENLFEDLK